MWILHPPPPLAWNYPITLNELAPPSPTLTPTSLRESSHAKAAPPSSPSNTPPPSTRHTSPCFLSRSLPSSTSKVSFNPCFFFRSFLVGVGLGSGGGLGSRIGFQNGYFGIAIAECLFWNDYSGIPIFSFGKGVPENIFRNGHSKSKNSHFGTSFLEKTIFSFEMDVLESFFWKKVHDVNVKLKCTYNMENWRRRETFALEPLMATRRRLELEKKRTIEKRSALEEEEKNEK